MAVPQRPRASGERPLTMASTIVRRQSSSRPAAASRAYSAEQFDEREAQPRVVRSVVGAHGAGIAAVRGFDAESQMTAHAGGMPQGDAHAVRRIQSAHAARASRDSRARSARNATSRQSASSRHQRQIGGRWPAGLESLAHNRLTRSRLMFGSPESHTRSESRPSTYRK